MSPSQVRTMPSRAGADLSRTAMSATPVHGVVEVLERLDELGRSVRGQFGAARTRAAGDRHDHQKQDQGGERRKEPTLGGVESTQALADDARLTRKGIAGAVDERWRRGT